MYAFYMKDNNKINYDIMLGLRMSYMEKIFILKKLNQGIYYPKENMRVS